MPHAVASSAMALPISSISSTSHVAPCVTSSGKTVPPAMAECSASLLKETGTPCADDAMTRFWMSLRASTLAWMLDPWARPKLAWPTPFLPMSEYRPAALPPYGAQVCWMISVGDILESRSSARWSIGAEAQRYSSPEPTDAAQAAAWSAGSAEMAAAVARRAAAIIVFFTDGARSHGADSPAVRRHVTSTSMHETDGT